MEIDRRRGWTTGATRLGGGTVDEWEEGER